MASKYLMENGTDHYLLEDGSGVYLMEGIDGARQLGLTGVGRIIILFLCLFL